MRIFVLRYLTHLATHNQDIEKKPKKKNVHKKLLHISLMILVSSQKY